MKAEIVSETPTQKVIERSKPELFHMGFEVRMFLAGMLCPAVSMASFIGLANGDPMVVASALSLGTTAFVAMTRGKNFNKTVKEFTGVTVTKKELQKTLAEGERMQQGDTQYTKTPEAFSNSMKARKWFEDKRLATHEVRSYAKKVDGKMVFEHVVTELPLKTWEQTFTELVGNAGLEMVDVSSNQLPKGTSYFESQSKGTLNEYKAKLDSTNPAEIEA